MQHQSPFEPGSGNISLEKKGLIARARPTLISIAMYPAAAMLVLGLFGLITNPSSSVVLGVLWALVLGSAAILLGIVFLVRGVPRELEEQYEQHLQEITERFVSMSARDWITGLLTPTEFLGVLKTEISRSKRYDRETAIVLIVPDQESIIGLSELEGAPEAIARYMADALVEALRETDVLGRLDEGLSVTAILPETDAAGAGIVGDRIISSFANRSVVLPDGGERVIPVSVALANYPGDGPDAEALLARAGARLS